MLGLGDPMPTQTLFDIRQMKLHIHNSYAIYSIDYDVLTYSIVAG